MIPSFDKIHSIVTLGLGALFVATLLHSMMLDRALDDARRQRDEAVRQRQAAERAIVVLADERAQADARKTIAQGAREAIVSLPEGNEPPVGESLRRSLQAADRIGGIE